MLRTSVSEEAAYRTQSGSWIQHPRATWLIFVIVTIALAVSVGLSRGGMFTLPDAEWYLRIARGDMHHVIQPFASRQLGPLLAQGIANRANASIESAFVIEAAFSILIAIATTGYLLIRSGVGWTVLLPVSLIAFWANLFNGLVLPDLLYAALTGIFLVLLCKQQFLAASLLLLPMQVCREATILVLFCFLIAGWRRFKLVHAGVALIATYAGMHIVKGLAGSAGANQDHVGPLLYMAGKIPWNFSKNLLGLPLWNNLNKPCEIPVWQTAIHIGGIRSVGVCSFSPAIPMWTLSMALATFGLFPLLLIYIWLQHRIRLAAQNILARFCLVYGLISFLLAPMLGASVPRLFSYSWPLFLVLVPILAHRYLRMKPSIFFALFAIHIVLGWMTIINHSRRLGLPGEVVMICVCVFGYAAAWLLLSRASRFSTVDPVDEPRPAAFS